MMVPHKMTIYVYMFCSFMMYWILNYVDGGQVIIVEKNRLSFFNFKISMNIGYP